MKKVIKTKSTQTKVTGLQVIELACVWLLKILKLRGQNYKAAERFGMKS
jgi:hypothetical protein